MEYYCKDCGKMISLGAKRCRSCSSKGELNSMYGKKHTKEWKKNKSKILKGRKFTEKHKKNISKARLGTKLAKRTKKAIGEALLGEKNPMYGRCGGDNPNFGTKRSEKTRKLISIGAKNRDPSTYLRGKDNPASREDVKALISKAHKKLWLDPEYCEKMRKARKRSPNKSEIKLNGILSKILPSEYKYVGNFEFWLGGRNPDFMNINGQKKLVELFGNYWHSEKRTGKTKNEHEKERINHFKEYGFSTLIIWEKELKDVKKTAKKLLSFHKQ